MNQKQSDSKQKTSAGVPGVSGTSEDITNSTGFPGARNTIDGRYLPNHAKPFGGEITPNATDSKQYWQGSDNTS